MSIITTTKLGKKYSGAIKLPDTFPDIQQHAHFVTGGHSSSAEARNKVEMRQLLNLYNKDREAWIIESTFNGKDTSQILHHIHYDDGWVIDTITQEATPSRECMQLSDAYDYYNQEDLFLSTCKYAFQKCTGHLLDMRPPGIRKKLFVGKRK